jgi:aminopeptidase N
LITEWFGAPRGKAETADLIDSDAAPFESGSLLVTPLASIDSRTAGLIAAHQLAHAAFTSPRPWINEGLAHFAQALYLEQQKGRQAALDYMAGHRFALSAVEGKKDSEAPRSDDEVNHSLINTADEELSRSKAMDVWWMLRDMIGDQALKKAIAAYRSDDDKEPSYMQRLIQAQTQRDLEWFFDDWVYRDRGLPDFKVQSAFTRKMLPEGYMLTVTLANLGAAGAEVPLIVKFKGGEVTKRLVVHGKSTAVIRVETLGDPEEIVVNDGSVPESDMTNNTFKIDSSDVAK